MSSFKEIIVKQVYFWGAFSLVKKKGAFEDVGGFD